MQDKRPHHQTESKDKVSIPQKIIFGSGLIPYTIMNNGFNNLLNIIFNMNFGVSPILLGLIAALERVFDAITDPVMGSITDNTKSRWGRRRPYLVLGGLLGGFFFAVLWWAPLGKSETFYFWWVLICALLLTTAFTIYSVPYIALSFEMTTDYHERTQVMAYKVAMGKIAFIIVGSLFWWTQRPVFDNTIEGMRYVGIGCGILIFIVALIPAFFVRENPEAALIGKTQKRIPLLKSMRETLSQPAFLLICAVTLSLICSLNLVNSLGGYISIYYIFDGVQRDAANVSLASSTAGTIIGLTTIPIVAYTSKRLGKRRTLACFLTIGFAGSFSKWFLYTPEYPYLQIIPNAMMGASYGATWLLLNAMIPEVCDLDELKTGTRREGMFSAVYSWTFKMGGALSVLGAGYVLVFSGFDADLKGNQSSEALWWMRFLFTLVPALGILFAMFLLYLLPISEDKAYEIKKQLEERHANLAG